jgi:hypothetical protein
MIIISAIILNGVVLVKVRPKRPIDDLSNTHSLSLSLTMNQLDILCIDMEGSARGFPRLTPVDPL